ncbi:fibronectin type III domain-containing protein, partial [Geodermatophilus sp. YIM 151500]|uniref:fibronectin type III domain-containing protein n=1 Tax=Geodermatophilus sp. YIM 151500 TaxID=2984531 RepID=UPI0021E4656C
VNGTTYTWTLVALDTAGNASAPSTVSAAPVAPPPPPPPPPADPAPAAPTAVSATPGDRQAVVRWTAPPDADVVGYAVLFEDGSTAATAPAPAGSVTVTGLTNGTTYRLTVVAVDAGENVSPPSAEVVVTPAAPVTTVGPEGAGQSGGLAASGDGRFVVIGTSARLDPSDTNSAYELHLRDRGTGTAVRIAPLPGYATGATDPTNTAAPAVSDDGRYVALATIQALDLAEDRNGTADVYRLDRSTGRWGLVSVPQGGTVSYTTPGTVLHTGTSIEATSPPVAMSADGRLVLFYSSRADLVAGDTNGVDDVFAKDMVTGAVTRVSTTATGGDLPHAALGPALTLTPDGRFALFTAAASGQAPVLYRKTLSGTGAGEATVVSTVLKGASTKTYSVERDAGHAAISDDGRYVALVTASKVIDSTSTSLYGNAYAYRKDTVTGAVVALGDPARRVHREDRVELDPTGRYAFFLTQAAFVAADTNGRPDHYRRDLDGGVAGPVVLVTADAGGRSAAGPGGSVTKAERGPLAALTGDSVLVTTSQALLPSDTNALRDLYGKDLLTGAVGVPLG